MKKQQIIYVASMEDVGDEDITGFGSTRDEAIAQVKRGYLKIKRDLIDGLPWKEAIDYHGLSVKTVAVPSVHTRSGRVMEQGSKEWQWAEQEALELH
jgi:hypothetical protein